MRKLKRILKHLNLYFRNRDMIQNSHIKLKEYFGNDIKIVFASFGGEDLNYTLHKNDKIFGVYRQSIPSQKNELKITPETPIQRKDCFLRVQKETFAYLHGGVNDLTPKLLYTFEYGVVCEYIEGECLWNIVKKNPSCIWDILGEVIRVYIKLHSLGITHLDATLKNCILDKRDNKIKVFDFEYYAIPEFDFKAQQAYDIVRIIEHSLRIVPLAYQNNFEHFISCLQNLILQEVKTADFNIVNKFIQGMKKFPIHTELKKQVFYNLL